MREDQGNGNGKGLYVNVSSSGLPRPPNNNYPSNLHHTDPNPSMSSISSSVAGGADADDASSVMRNSSFSGTSPGNSFYSERPSDCSPYNLSPWNQSSPFSKSPWTLPGGGVAPVAGESSCAPNGLIGSLVREEGHIYSLAATGDLLFTGSDSKNIRVWKNQKEYSGFKSNSGLVKAIIISGARIFTGHQDGKIRVWKVSSRNAAVYKRAGTLPTMKDYLKSSIKPSNYVEVRRRRNSLWLKHYDTVSCLSLNEDQGILYSGSWDKTLKVWRLSDLKCLESINAHDDAVNSVVAGFDGLVFTGSADGTVKVWRREIHGSKTKHFFLQTLLKQESAVTALAVNPSASVVYCGSSDGLVNLWERETQLSHGGILRGHKQAVLCLAAAGSLIFSGSADKTICVWRRDRGAHSCLSVLDGHAGPVKCLAAERDKEGPPEDRGWILYSGSLDKSVKVWRVSEVVGDMPSWDQVPADEAAENSTSTAAFMARASPAQTTGSLKQ